MREILFRGKRADNGEWVEGNFFRPNRILQRYGNGFFKNIEVIQETVGQYTGLTDNKGKKIFEGDIVKTRKCFGSEIGLVIFTNCEFQIQGLTPNIPENTNYGFWQVKPDIEVIGNKWDNPELLEEKEIEE